MHHNKIGVKIDDKLEATSLKKLKNKPNKTICPKEVKYKQSFKE